MRTLALVALKPGRVVRRSRVTREHARQDAGRHALAGANLVLLGRTDAVLCVENIERQRVVVCAVGTAIFGRSISACLCKKCCVLSTVVLRWKVRADTGPSLSRNTFRASKTKTNKHGNAGGTYSSKCLCERKKGKQKSYVFHNQCNSTHVHCATPLSPQLHETNFRLGGFPSEVM